MLNSLIKHIGVLVFIILVIVSCNNPEKIISPLEFISWIDNPENDLIVEKQLNDLLYSLEYKPAEYKTIKNLEKNDFTPEQYRNYLNEFRQFLHFILKVKNLSGNNNPIIDNVSSNEEYEQRIRYLSFDFNKDIKLISCNDTIDCTHFHFERSYNVTPYSAFSLGFQLPEDYSDHKKLNCDYTLWIEDKLFGNGYIFLKIENKNLIKIPQIQFDYD